MTLIIVILHIWLAPAAFLYGSCFYTRPTLRDALRCGALMLGWPITLPAIWILNKWMR